MAERRTLAQLRSERARKGNSLNVEVDMEAGRVVVLAVSPVDISDINRSQLGTNKAGGTMYKLDPAPEGELAELAEPLDNDALAQQLRDWYGCQGVAAAAAAAVAAGKRLIRAKGNPETNPNKLGAFGSAAVGEAAPKKREAPGTGSKGAKKQKAEE